jgi:hypothetical protein
MIAYILLRGKDFSLPDDVSTAIVGIFFGLVCGLFYYQHYYRNYYWWFSLGGGLILTYLSQKVLDKPGTESDPARTVASFVVPFVLTLLLNQALYFVKHSKRKKRRHKKTHSDFFSTIGSAIPRSKNAIS